MSPHDLLRTGARLRGHHLICLQFFRGEGYSEEFVLALTRVLERLESLPAELVAGADDVCAACPELGADGRCASGSAGGEPEIARIDALACELLGLAPGARARLADVREQLADDAIAAGRWRYEACDGCEWEHVCERGWGDLLAAAERAARER